MIAASLEATLRAFLAVVHAWGAIGFISFSNAITMRTVNLLIVYSFDFSMY